MAHIKKFHIQNFKGIDDMEIYLTGNHNCPVTTLVGLNESGKTTILEALSHFPTRIDTVSETAKSSDYLSLVPITKKANFTGDIKVAATICLNDSDVEDIDNLIKSHGLNFNKDSIKREFKVTRSYEFEDGNYRDSEYSNLWDLSFQVKTKRAKNFKRYERPSSEQKEAGEVDLWIKVVDEIKNELPSIAYFPTFLVDVPDRIYLEKVNGEHPSQTYYREVIQDVLNSLDEPLNIKTHIIDRIKKFQEESDGNWISKFFSNPIKGQVDSVIQKISGAITREVVGSWKNVFSRPIAAKMITLDWHIDPEKENTPYLEIGISDGESKYSLHERSLGFRWFFLFLLFTRFKSDNDRASLFLLDEPAANLHAKAQTELLKSFEKIVEHNNRVVYSTHSPHMINPNWIPGAHIVENKAIDYDSDIGLFDYSSPPTSIDIIPYRQFVSNSSHRVSYFQPIIEKLEHTQPQIFPGGSVIVTEGISDFHAFNFYCGDLIIENDISLLPGLGDTQHGPHISLLISKGVKFLILLDADASGKRGAKRYREKWLLDNSFISTIGELVIDADGKNLESLLSDKTKQFISSHFGKSTKPSKSEIGLYFAEANAGLIDIKSDTTSDLVTLIMKKAIELVKSQ